MGGKEWVDELIAELQIQILPLIENLEWLYIWGVVRSSDGIVRRSVGRSVGRLEDLRIGGWGIFGDLGGMVDLPDIMVDLPDTMVDLPDTMDLS